MLNKVLTRIQNKKVAMAVVSGILMILVNLGIVDVSTSEKVTEVATIILGLLVSIGIFSNPDSHVKVPEKELEGGKQ